MNFAPDKLSEIEAGVFPSEVFDDCESALMLFCAGSYGANDCVWAARAGVSKVTAIDDDVRRLRVMKALYPSHWNFVRDDVYAWAAARGGTFDLVTVDAPITDGFKSFGLLPTWCRLATKTVVLAALPHTIDQQGIVVDRRGPMGWWVTDVVERNAVGAAWIVWEQLGE